MAPRDSKPHGHPIRTIQSSRRAQSVPKAMARQTTPAKPGDDLIGRIKRKRAIRQDLRQLRIEKGLRSKTKRKKMAVALGASAITLNTAAVGTGAFYMPSAAMASAQFQDPTQVRVPASQILVSDQMKMALIEEEGMHHTVYADPVGYLTVGVGHLVTSKDNLKVGDRISQGRMALLLEQDLRIAEDAVVQLVGDLPLYQHEFDALVDLVFNVGAGNLSREESPKLNRAIEVGDYEAIAEELAYHNAAGQKLKGLEYRSDRREKIFMEASYDNPRSQAGVTRT